MTLEKLTKAIIDFGVDIEYINITDANNPLFVMSAEYEKRGYREYVIRINKNKDEKNLLFRVAANLEKSYCMSCRRICKSVEMRENDESQRTA